MPELTEYEKERDARIARNKAMLAALGLEVAADDVKSLPGGRKKVVGWPRRSKRAVTATAGSDEEGSSNGDMDSEEDEYRPTREENASDEEKNDNLFDDSASEVQVSARSSLTPEINMFYMFYVRPTCSHLSIVWWVCWIRVQISCNELISSL